MGQGSRLPIALDAIPVVRSTSDRLARFPDPDVNQRVQNLGTGAIERWNGADWVTDFLNVGNTTGTPAVLANGEQVLLLPAAIDFRGRVEGEADGSTAAITIPDLPILKADGTDLVASPTTLQFKGTGITSAVDGDGNVVFVVTAGGGIAVQKAGTALGPASTLNVAGQGFTLTVDGGGLATLTLLGAARSVVSFTTAALETGDVATGTVDLGALCALLFATCDKGIWLRVYSTAADRTADDARDQDADPTTPIILDVIFANGGGTVRLFDVSKAGPVFGANRDNPAVNNLYYSVTMLDETLGPFATTAEDDVQTSPPGSDTDLSAHTPTTPHASGWTLWQYHTTDTDRFHIWGTFGGILPKATSADAKAPARTNVDFDQRAIRMTADVFRLAIDGTTDSAGFAFRVPNDTITGYDNTRYLRAYYARESGTSCEAIIDWVDAAGTVHSLGSHSAIGLNLSESLRLIVELVAGTVKLYSAVAGTGATKTLLVTASVPDDIATNTRIGVVATRQLGSSGIQIQNILIEQQPVVAEAATVAITRTQLERVG